MDIKQDIKVGKRQDNKMSIGWDNKMGIKQDDDKVNDLGQDNKKAAVPAIGVYIEVQRLLRHVFLLGTHSNSFFTFSSLKTVINWPLSTGLGSIANSSILIILTNHDTLFLK